MAIRPHMSNIRTALKGVLDESAPRSRKLAAINRLMDQLRIIRANLNEQEDRSIRDDAALTAGIVDSLGKIDADG